MGRSRESYLVMGGILVLAIVVCLLVYLPSGDCWRLAALEYMHPTTTQLIQLPPNCVGDNQQPTAEMLRILDAQRKQYRLTVQKVVTCTIQSPSGGATIADSVMQKNSAWLPTYVGCCTFQFRRHFVVVMATPSDRGSSVLFTAALIQSRSDYFRFLRLHCDQKLSQWR